MLSEEELKSFEERLNKARHEGSDSQLKEVINDLKPFLISEEKRLEELYLASIKKVKEATKADAEELSKLRDELANRKNVDLIDNLMKQRRISELVENIEKVNQKNKLGEIEDRLGNVRKGINFFQGYTHKIEQFDKKIEFIQDQINGMRKENAIASAEADAAAGPNVRGAANVESKKAPLSYFETIIDNFLDGLMEALRSIASIGIWETLKKVINRVFSKQESDTSTDTNTAPREPQSGSGQERRAQAAKGASPPPPPPESSVPSLTTGFDAKAAKDGPLKSDAGVGPGKDAEVAPPPPPRPPSSSPPKDNAPRP